jgi:hypothetical protein
MGSRILSRSFHVEKWEGEDDENPLTINGMGCAMDVDEETLTSEAEVREETEESDDDSEGEDVEDPSDVAMVPMADILNARYGSENVCIFIRAPFTIVIHDVSRLNSSMKKKTSKWSPPNLSKQAIKLYVSCSLALRRLLSFHNYYPVVEHLR